MSAFKCIHVLFLAIMSLAVNTTYPDSFESNSYIIYFTYSIISCRVHYVFILFLLSTIDPLLEIMYVYKEINWLAYLKLLFLK